MTQPRTHKIASGTLGAATPNAVIYTNTTGGVVLVKEVRLLNTGVVGNQVISLNYQGTGLVMCVTATVAAQTIYRENNCYIVLEAGDALQIAHSSAVSGCGWFIGGLTFA